MISQRRLEQLCEPGATAVVSCEGAEAGLLGGVAPLLSVHPVVLPLLLCRYREGRWEDQIPPARAASGSRRRYSRVAATRAKRITRALRRPASSFVALPSRSTAAPKESATIRPHSSGISARGKSFGTAK